MLNDMLAGTIRSFDGGKKAGEEKPEKFWQELKLGFLSDRLKMHRVKSSREGGYGRYDVVLDPIRLNGTAVIMEFKLFDAKEESLEDTCRRALEQIENRNYESDLLVRGIPKENIVIYGLGFGEKECLAMRG